MLHGHEFRDVTSEGLATTLFPAAKAGAIFLTAMSNGWLKGYLRTMNAAYNVDRDTYGNVGNDSKRNPLNIVQ